MPYTAQQRRLFHSAEENPEVAREHGMSRREAGKLAREADKLTKEGKERKPVSAKAAELPPGFIDLTDVYKT